MANADLTVLLKATDDASKVVEEAEGHFGKLGESLADVGKIAAGVALGGLITDIQSGLTGALEHGLEAAQEFGNEVFKLQSITGDTAESTSALLSVLEKYGVSGDEAARSFGTLSKGLAGLEDPEAKAVAGGKSVLTVLKDLGIEATTASGETKPFNDVLLDIADRFHDMPDGAQKTAEALALFGRQGKDLIPILDLGAEGLKELEKDAEKYGLTLTQDNIQQVRDFTLAHKSLDEAIQGLELQIGLVLIPALLKLVDTLTPLVEEFNQQLLPVIKDVASALGVVLGPAFDALVISVQATADVVQKITGFFNDNWVAMTALEAIAAAYVTTQALMLAGTIAQTVAMVAQAAPLLLWIGQMYAAQVATDAWAFAQGALDVVLDANPIGLVIVAIAALIVIVYECVQHIDDITLALQNFWDAFNSSPISLFLTIALGPFGVMLFSLIETIGFVATNLQELWQGFENLVNVISGLLGQINGLKNALASIPSHIATSITQTVEQIHVPGFASGTSFAPGGMALVGEAGPELVNLPRGSQVYPHGTGPGGGGFTVNVYGDVYGIDDFNAKVDQGIRSGAIRVTSR